MNDQQIDTFVRDTCAMFDVRLVAIEFYHVPISCTVWFIDMNISIPAGTTCILRIATELGERTHIVSYGPGADLRQRIRNTIVNWTPKETG